MKEDNRADYISTNPSENIRERERKRTREGEKKEERRESENENERMYTCSVSNF